MLSFSNSFYITRILDIQVILLIHYRLQDTWGPSYCFQVVFLIVYMALLKDLSVLKELIVLNTVEEF